MKGLLSSRLGFLALLALSADNEPTPPQRVTALQHVWRVDDGKYWHIESTRVEDPATTDAVERTRGACPAGMVEVAGQMKVARDDEDLDALQLTTCTERLDPAVPERCAAYDEDAWLELSKDLPTQPMRFCIDRFEYPNRKGDYPFVAVSGTEAAALCESRSERLCSEDEWTFACEGEQAWPYPYGFARDDTACVIDRPYRPVDERALGDRESAATLIELDRLWQGEWSGSRPRCRSPFGVYDLTGNVDEWARSVRPEGYPSILKGGYWGPVRTRCLASTRAHGEGYYDYQQGLRCCADVPAR